MTASKKHSGDGFDDDVTSATELPTEHPVREAIQDTDRWKRHVHHEAKLLASLGYYVLPIKRLDKKFPKSGFNANSASNDPKQIDAWFHPEKGEFAGYNLAIACGRKDGHSVVVADADRHGRGDGVDEWKNLINRQDEPEAHPWAKTPNDGEHHLFRHHPAFARKSTKLSRDSGLEILGGKDGSFTSFIAVYPSVVKDRRGLYRQYEWEVHPRECLLPPAPDWLVTEFGSSEGLRGDGRGNENVTDRDIEPQVPIVQIERMLAAIDPDDLSYDEWLSIGMAIHSQHQDDNGLELWDRWSQRGDRYRPGECEKRWRGFTAAGERARVTVGTVFYHAKKAGWKPAEDDAPVGFASLKVVELNKTYAFVVVGGTERIIRLRPDHGPGDLHYDLMKVSAFKRSFPGEFVPLGEDKSRPLPDVWLDSPFRRSYPYGLGLYPDKDAPPGVFNTWNGFAYVPVKGDCSLFLAHLRNVVCGGNDEHYEWLMDWCADCVQDPGNLKGTAVVMRGKEGTGKGTFADTMGKLFGAHYVHLIDPSHLLGNFNAHLIDAIFVFADEITWGGNVKTQGKLKGLVTEQQLLGERKGVDAVAYRNFAHVVIATNADWAIPAGSNSRRWFVLEIDDSHANNRAYFHAIYNELNNGGYEALLYELQNRKIARNLRLAPHTKALAEQRRLSATSRDKFYEFLDHRLEEGHWGDYTPLHEHPDHGFCLEKAQVYSDYKNFVKSLGGVPLSEVTFWKQWLRVFPYARGNQKEWPRLRLDDIVGKRQRRVTVLRSREQTYKDFAGYYGTAEEEVAAALEDWHNPHAKVPDAEGKSEPDEATE